MFRLSFYAVWQSWADQLGDHAEPGVVVDPGDGFELQRSRLGQTNSGIVGPSSRGTRGHLIPLMKQHLPRRNPLLVVLDPYGMEVDWSLLEQLAAFRQGRYKAELLILLSIDGVNRAMHVGATNLRMSWHD